jgi:hypothetical protein
VLNVKASRAEQAVQTVTGKMALTVEMFGLEKRTAPQQHPPGLQESVKFLDSEQGPVQVLENSVARDHFQAA